MTLLIYLVIICIMIAKEGIDNGKDFDWGKVSEDYAKFRDIYPELFYKKIIEMGLCLEGQRVLDLGTGTGVLPRNLYKYGASFVGADISENQIEQAGRLSAEAGLDIEFIVSSAEEISFPDKSFDAVTACCCFIYFEKDIVLPKIHKILKDGGQFCILSLVWLPDENEIAARSEEMILKYNPLWTGGGMKRKFAEMPEWPKGLFKIKNAEVFDLNIGFTRESWNGRMKACRGMGASSLSESEMTMFEKEHMEFLKSQPESFEILHQVRVLNLQKI